MIRILAALSILASMIAAQYMRSHYAVVHDSSLAYIFAIGFFTSPVLAMENLFRKGTLRWTGAAYLGYLALSIAVVLELNPKRIAEILSNPVQIILCNALLLLLVILNFKKGVERIKAKRV